MVFPFSIPYQYACCPENLCKTYRVPLQRFQITHNLSLDGVLNFMNSKNMNEAGPLDLIDDDDSDTEEGVEKQSQKRLGYDLSGSMPNRCRPIIQTKCLRIAQTGRSWAAANTEGVLLYTYILWMTPLYLTPLIWTLILLRRNSANPMVILCSIIPETLQKAATRLHQDLADTCSSNGYMLRYLCSTSNIR